jgi:hypothetical protein
LNRTGGYQERIENLRLRKLLETTGMTTHKDSRLLIIYFLLFVPLGILVCDGNVRKQAYYDVFGVDDTDTVGDYKSSARDAKIFWLLNACDNGACLLVVDWKCGFDNGDEDLVHSCISSEIQTSDLGITLDTIRKRCGRAHMKFVGELYAEKSDCEELAGTWGKKN